MDWEEAISQAKEDLGYYQNQYIDDWDEVVETAKEILQEVRDEEWEEQYEEFCEEYKEYLKSERWRELRLKILQRDNYQCRDCSQKATEVHHLDYDFLKTDAEEKFCVSLCHMCHGKRHGIKNEVTIDVQFIVHSLMENGILFDEGALDILKNDADFSNKILLNIKSITSFLHLCACPIINKENLIFIRGTIGKKWSEAA